MLKETKAGAEREREVVAAWEILTNSITRLEGRTRLLVDRLKPIMSNDLEKSRQVSHTAAYTTPLAVQIQELNKDVEALAELVGEALRRLEI